MSYTLLNSCLINICYLSLPAMNSYNKKNCYQNMNDKKLLPFLLVLLVVFVLTYSFLKFICFFDKDILWVVFLYAILQNPGITLLKRGNYHGHFHVYNKIKRNFPPWKRNLMSSAGDSQEIPPSQNVVIANDWLKMTYLFNATNRKA